MSSIPEQRLDMRLALVHRFEVMHLEVLQCITFWFRICEIKPWLQQSRKIELKAVE
jgi:hypothetical protein